MADPFIAFPIPSEEITDLAEMTGAEIDRENDVMIIRDVSTNEDKQAKVGEAIVAIVGAASESVPGVVRLATEEETFEQQDLPRAVHPRALRRYARSVATIADLLELERVDGQQVSVLSYHNTPHSGKLREDKGGGVFYWSSSTNKSSHDGGTIIDPDIPFPENWGDKTSRSEWFAPSVGGTGCWVRSITGPLSSAQFGSTSSDADDDTESFSSLALSDAAIYVPAGRYLIDGGLTLTYNALRFTGDGISTWIKGTSGHTITMAAGQADGVFEHLWVDQIDENTIPQYDAIHLDAGEMHVNFCDVDFADRYGIYVGAYRTSVLQYSSQHCRDTSIFVDSGAYAFQGTDMTFENAGAGIVGNCLSLNGERAVVKGVSAFNPQGYILSCAGTHNTLSCLTGVFSSNAGAGTISEHAYIFNGGFNASSSMVSRGAIGNAYLISGNNNTLSAIVSNNSTKEGLRVTGQNNVISGRIAGGGGSGEHNAVSVENSGNVLNLSVGAPAGPEKLGISISNNNNSLTGITAGDAGLFGSRNSVNLISKSVTVSDGLCNYISGVIEGGEGAGLVVSTNSNAIAITVDNAGEKIATISGSSNIGFIRGFGSSGDGIEISGDDNELQLRASGTGGSAIKVSGSFNNLQINAHGDVVVSGQYNVITGIIRGNITFTEDSSFNKFFGRATTGQVDSGTNNVLV